MYLYCILFHKREHFAANAENRHKPWQVHTHPCALNEYTETEKQSGKASVNFCE